MKKNNKFLFIALPLAIVLLGFVFYDYGYLTIQSEIAANKDLGLEKKKILKKYLTLIADKPQLEAKLAALQEARKLENLKTIEGETPAVAAAALQNNVKGLITARGGTIASERVEKSEELGKFQIITVAIDAVLPDIRALSDTLYAIEMQTPSLVVRELDAMTRNYQTPKEITVRLKLSGLTGGK